MKKIYIDVTSLTEVDFVTGIQRVVRNVILEMYKVIPQQLMLITYSMKRAAFLQLDIEQFVKYYSGEKTDKKKMFTTQKVELEQLGQGDIFFDIDSVWNLPYKRSVLLPQLKAQGVKLAVYVYDIIPITHPQFCYEETTFLFMNYIGAYLLYADIVITSTRSTLDEVFELKNKLGIDREIRGSFSWLGSDFVGEKKTNTGEVKDVVKLATKSPYILCVGTIEPRKNHVFLLDAFEKALYKKGINLVIAGKVGWNVEELMQRIQKSEYYNKQLFRLTGLDDNEIEYLYQNALALAFPTYNEGFGLPMVEALERGTPVLASDIPVLREVGGEYCEYFSLEDEKEFVQKVCNYIEHEDEYQKIKDRVSTFTSFTWEETAKRIIDALNEYENRS